jgi:hypothetical protein
MRSNAGMAKRQGDVDMGERKSPLSVNTLAWLGFEMWCWRKMEKISWTDNVRN